MGEPSPGNDKWEAGMKMLGREAEWGRFPNDVLIYSSLSRFPPECDRFIGKDGHGRHDVTAEAVFNAKSWRVMSIFLKDVSGAEVGDLIVLRDVSAAKAAFNWFAAVTSGLAVVFLTALFGFLHILLKRTDRGLRLQQVKLIESRERLNNFINSATDGFTLWDSNFELVEINNVALNMFPEGTIKEDIIGENILRLVPEIEETGRYDQIKKALETGESLLINNTVLNIKFGNRHLSLRIFRVGDGVGLISTDITERKQAEENLLMSEKFQRTLTETSPDYILVIDADRTIRKVNRLLPGYREEDVIGKKDELFIPPEYHNSFYNTFRQAIDTKQLQILETAIDMPDERHYYLNRLNPVLLTGEEISVVLISTDITERKKSEEQVAIFRKFTEASEQGMRMADLDGNIIYTNSTLCRFMGEKIPEGVYGKNVRNYYTSEELTILENEILPEVLEKGYKTAEVSLQSIEGSITSAIQSIFLIRNDQGDPLYLANVITDIIERKQSEEELRTYKEHLEDIVKERTNELVIAKNKAESSSRAKGEFLANMSHELRTPLNSILGFSKLMKMGYDQEEYTTNLENIISSGEHLLRLINDVLNLIRLEAGKLDITMEPVVIHNIINETLALVRSLAFEKGIEIDYKAQSEEIIVFGDQQ